jgi:hypothetical protein
MRIDPACIVRDTPAQWRRACRAGLRVALVLGALLPLGFAAEPAGAQTAERRYQVEVVIFLHPAGTSVEQPPRRRAPTEEAEQQPPFGEPADPVPPGPGYDLDTDGPEETGSLLPEGFSAPAMPRRLDAVARRLNTGDYRLLWHQAWVQPPLDRLGPELAALAALGQGPATAGLSGNISLTAGRFLHLGMEIELDSADGFEAAMHQRRRIRPGVEQYFDHPHIGMVAVVRPVEVEQLPVQSTP